jgi:hypothetical protein
MRTAFLLGLCAALLATAASAESLLLQSGQDSAPYAFQPGLPRGFHPSGYAYTLSDETGDHSFEYFIQWNLPPVLFEPGVEVEQALAWVYYGFDNPTEFGDFTDEIGELRCHEVLQPWSQNTMTWQNKAAYDNYFDATFDILNYGMYWCNVTELVRQWIADPSTNHGIALTSTRQRVMGFYSFEHPIAGPNLKPSLLVEVTNVPEPGAAAGLVSGCLLLIRLERQRERQRRNPDPA